jgi:hypothetical protein
MCCIADMWDAEACIKLCYAALARLQPHLLRPTEFAEVLDLLPEAVSSTPEQQAWERLCLAVTSTFVSQHKDVHQMLTAPDQLLSFQQLPFMVVKAWAASDDLVVDSEDSVVLALGRWIMYYEGRKCSEEQLGQLSGLIRVRHLTAGM